MFGTRPEAIQMAPGVKVLETDDHFESKVTITGQHRQMLDQVLMVFDIVRDFDLDIIQANQDLVDITVRVMTGVRGIIQEYQPDVILVQ